MRPVKKVALLHDLCGVGKAALTNMVPVLSVMGIEACPIPQSYCRHIRVAMGSRLWKNIHNLYP